MSLYNEKSLRLLSFGREDCSNLHSWGPGMRQCYIIHYIIKGSGTLELNGKAYPVKENESFIIYPYTMVRYYPAPSDPWEYTWVEFGGQQTPLLLNHTCFTPKAPVCPHIPRELLLPYYQQLVLLDVYSQNHLEANGLFHTILGIYGDKYPSSAAANGSSGEDTRLTTALMLVHTNYHKSSFNVEMLCRLTSVNRVTLYRLFKNGLDISPNSYIIHYRLEQSKKLLQMNLTVKDASVSCGFSDPFYFSKAFKQHTGISPLEYKKKAKPET